MEGQISGIKCIVYYIGTSCGLYCWLGVCRMGKSGDGVEVDGWFGCGACGGTNLGDAIYARDSEMVGTSWEGR